MKESLEELKMFKNTFSINNSVKQIIIQHTNTNTVALF